MNLIKKMVRIYNRLVVLGENSSDMKVVGLHSQHCIEGTECILIKLTELELFGIDLGFE